MVNYLSDPSNFKNFESLYIRVRDKEQRVYDDEVVSCLPFISKADSVHYKEWRMRAKSFRRILKYFKNQNRINTIMDLGCGNGWLSARLWRLPGKEIFGVDINETELVQADRVFTGARLHFCFGNINENIFPENSFDAIILNSCIQYFENIPELINRLFYFLKPAGEIHIVDSPLYQNNEIDAARKRTFEYYNRIGVPEMAANYFHHSLDELEKFNPDILSGTGIFRKINSRLQMDLPVNFYWIKIKKGNAD